MARTTRTFVAVAVPGDRASKLERLQTLIAPELPGAQWVLPGQFHATLAFLGDVPDTDLHAVCGAVAEASAGLDPFELRLETLGVFPGPSRPRVAWVGLGGPEVDRLVMLQKAIVAAVDRAGYPPEDDRFSPHVTLGRLKPRRGEDHDLSALLRHYQRWSAGSWTVDEVVTFASTLGPEGPDYTPLAKAPLEGRKRPSSP